MNPRSIRRAAVIAVVGATAVAGASLLTGCVPDAKAHVQEGAVHVTKDGKETFEKDGVVVDAAGKKVLIEANGASATVKCTGGEEIDLVGHDGTITLTGSCGHVEVTSSKQKITAETISGVKLTSSDTTFDAGTIEKDVVVFGSDIDLTYGEYNGSGAPALFGANINVGMKGQAPSATATPMPTPAK
ncbi:hypothetical protein [Leifsonia shinshuensis]|uniref:hypothetical protein n=1 Tax=Leifsonia shinshuensis TaxID=150026 RepID=UPI002864C0FC|nr:hypothetical protein [Leifsonia shinshuensis]MDR6971719.1 hypothetical protein [Leifsonia shinshuensis]